MAYLATDAIWTAIAERIEGVNTTVPRAMPTSGDGFIKCDRVEGAENLQLALRTIGQPVASIQIEADRSPNTTPMPGNLFLYDLTITVRIGYNLTSQAEAANQYQHTKSLAQRHFDMLTQALCYPGVLAVTTAAGVKYDGTTLSAGTATGLVSGMLFPGPCRVMRDDGGNSDSYETELVFTATALVTAATS